jgi:transposase InsO family protein
VRADEEALIIELRTSRKLGVRRLQSELWYLHGFQASLATIHKVLKRHEVKSLKRPRRSKQAKRYQRAVPGDRVQMDTCKVRAGLYLYTAIDDCTRCLQARLYARRTAKNTIDFMKNYLGSFVFPIQRIQTDRGKEFTAYEVIEWLESNSVKWRPIRPASPHLNGKVERVQRTVLDELFAALDADLSFEEYRAELEDWIDHYNRTRVHGAIGQPPINKALDLENTIPDANWTWAEYDLVYEHRRNSYIGMPNEQSLIEKLKRSM